MKQHLLHSQKTKTGSQRRRTFSTSLKSLKKRPMGSGSTEGHAVRELITENVNINQKAKNALSEVE